MATLTENYKLNKPDRTDEVNIEVLNENFDKIDKELKDRLLYIVTFSGNDSDGFTADKSYTAVKEAIDAGLNVIAKAEINQLVLNLSLDYVSENTITFQLVSFTGYAVYKYSYILDSTDTVTRHEYLSRCLPGVDESINGYVLCVVDGEPTWAEASISGTQPVALTTDLDFTNWANGYFIESLSDGTSVEHKIVFDTDGVPTSISGITVTGVS